MMEALKSARFSPKYDIALLKEIVAQNPFAQKNNKEKWLNILGKMNDLLAHSTSRPNVAFTERGCKDRMKILVNALKKESLASLKASGTEEEYCERDQLLTEVVELMQEKENIVKEAEKNELEKEKQGSDVRRMSMERLSKKRAEHDSAHSEAVPTKKKRMVHDYIEYMREKDEADRKLKEEELKLKREQVELEKKREEQRSNRENLMMELLTKIADKLN